MAHLVYQPQSLTQLCFVPRASSAVASVHTSPSHKVRHRLHILHEYALVALVKYLVILADSFWYFSLICYPAHINSHRNFILHIFMYHFFAFLHQRNNATVSYFLKFMRFLKICILFTSRAFTYEGCSISSQPNIENHSTMKFFCLSWTQ